MRKLVYFIAASLDGFIARDSDTDPTGTVFDVEGDHLPALIAEYPEMIPGQLRGPLGLTDVPARHFDTVLEGRATHQIGLDLGVVNAYPHLRHLVFSRTLEELSDPAIELVRGDAVERVRELKQQDGLDIWLCGGGALAGALRDEIDELHLKLHPVVLGSGVPLFVDAAGDRTIDRYRLQSCRAFDSGVVLLTYRRR